MTRSLLALVLAAACGATACGDGGGGMPPACMGAVGTAGCACRMDDTCEGDLVCAEMVCVAGAVRGVALPAGARGCEILLIEDTGRLTDVRFTAVDGTFVREAPQVAVTVMQGADEDFPEGAVELVTSAEARLTVASSSCVDSVGAPISGARVEIR